jgi:hypothetical protein
VAFGLGAIDVAKLAVDLSLKGNFSSALSTSQKQLKGLNTAISESGSRAFRAGQQIGTGIKRSVILGTAALTSLAGLFIVMAKEGQNAANVQKVFATAVANSTKVSAAQVKALNAQQDALLELAGVDDELIKQSQTRLIQMGLTGAQVLKLTPAILDLSKATGIDLLTATKLAGKAAEGNVTALQRYGIMIDKAKAKTDPFGATLDALTKKFGGTTKALSGSLDTRLAVLRERLANVREEAGQKLLPALIKITDVVSKNLVPAFNDFIQSILPGVVAGLDQVADFLKSGGAVSSFKSIFATIRTAAPILEATAKATFTIVKAAVDLFTSLPPEIQNLAVGAFAINKLTGGLVTNVAGGIIEGVAGLLGKTRGSSPANPVFVSAGPGGFLGPGGSGALSNLVALGVAGAIVAAAVPIGEAFASVLPDWLKGPGGAGKSESQTRIENARAAQGGGAKLVTSPVLDRGGREQGTPGIAGLITKDIRNVLNAVTATFKTGFQRMVDALKNARGTDAIRKALQEANRLVIQNHKGDLGNTAKTIAALKSALAHTSDPKLRAEIKSSLAKVQSLLPGRAYAARVLAATNAALKDGKLSIAEEKAAKTAIRALNARGLPHAAALIQNKINEAKRAQVAATNNVANKIRNQKFTITGHIEAQNQQSARVSAANSFIRIS